VQRIQAARGGVRLHHVDEARLEHLPQLFRTQRARAELHAHVNAQPVLGQQAQAAAALHQHAVRAHVDFIHPMQDG
jgi:hypothetical protein